MIRLRALQMRNVGAFTDRKIEFVDGFNLVIGPNEAGKTTLLRTVVAVLFGTGTQALCPVGFHGSHGAALRLDAGKRQFIIDRDFSDHRVQVFEIVDQNPKMTFDAKVSPRGRSGDVAAYAELLADMIGLADPDLFFVSAILTHEDLSLGDRNTAKKIKQILAGQATHDYDAVIEGLFKKYFEITSLNPDGRNKNKARQLELVCEQLSAVESRLEQANTGQRRCKELQNSIDRTKERIEKIEKKIAQTDRLVTVAAQYFSHEQGREECAQKHQRFDQEKRRISDLRERIEAFDRQLTELGIATTIDEKAADRLKSKMSLEKRIEDKKNLHEQALRSVESAGNESKAGIFGAGAAALVFLVLAVGALFKSALLALPFVVGCAGFALLAAHLNKLRKERLGALSQQAQSILDEVEKLKTLSSSIDQDPALAAMSAEAIPALLADRDKSIGLAREKEKVAAQLEVLPSMADLDEALGRLERELAVLEERKAHLAKIHPELTKFDHDQLFNRTSQLSELEQQQENLEKQLAQDRETFAALAAVTESPESLIEQREDLLERKAVLEQRRDAVLEAVRAIQWAVDEYRGEYMVDFSQRVASIFCDLLGDDQRTVSFDNEMEPSLKTKDKILKIENLSSGTRDPLYFAGRIALAERLAGNKALPFLLDDPLLTFDKERKRRAVGTLIQVGKTHQVVFFTHDEATVDLVDAETNIIRIG